MPSTIELRKLNLRTLVAQWNGPTGLAKKLKLSGPSYVSQMLTGTRPITEKTARKIESVVGLSAGWLDNDHEQTATPVAIDAARLTEAIVATSAALETEKRKLGHDKFAELVALVYEETGRQGGLSDEYVKRLIRLMR